MTRLVTGMLCAFMLCFGLDHSAHAQSRARVVVSTPTAAVPASVVLLGVLADNKFDQLMRSGFPLRMHMTAELWKTGGVIDQLTAKIEWETVVSFDVLDRTYEVVRVTFEQNAERKPPRVASLGIYKTLDAARIAAELPFAPVMPIAEKGKRSYIAVQADVQTMEMSDLDEVQAWLRGDPHTVGEPRRNRGNFVGRGLRSVFARLLGAEVRHYEGKSNTFTL